MDRLTGLWGSAGPGVATPPSLMVKLERGGLDDIAAPILGEVSLVALETALLSRTN